MKKHSNPKGVDELRKEEKEEKAEKKEAIESSKGEEEVRDNEGDSQA